MRFLIACGGTGGHFYPGYVLGKALRARGHEPLFVLRREDPAAPRLEAEGLPYTELDLRGLPRRLGGDLLLFPLRLAASLLAARRLVRSWRPTAAAGMGGYLSFPVAAAARLAGVPLILHESNAVLGLANRAARPWARTLALGLPLAEPAQAGATATLLTGTPVRPELWERRASAAARGELGLDPGKPTLLVFGGSQGARAINRAVPAALALLPEGGRPQVLHLSGAKEEEDTRAAYLAARVAAQVRGYLSEMHLAYAAADLVLCRSGASTLAELAAQAKPALLVPYPHAADDHQAANARLFERAGAARLLRQTEMTPQSLAGMLASLLEPASLARMSAAFGGLGLPEPARCERLLADAAEALATMPVS